MTKARRVLVESPYAASAEGGPRSSLERNLAYTRRAMRDCFERGEAPFASHALFTQPGVLDDRVPGQRRLGIAAGLLWGLAAEVTAVYTDLGTSTGMVEGIAAAEAAGRPCEYRTIAGWWTSQWTASECGEGVSGCWCVNGLRPDAQCVECAVDVARPLACVCPRG